MNNRKGSIKSKKAKCKSKSAKPAVRKKACKPPKSWFDLTENYNNPYLRKLGESLRKGALEKENQLVEMITGRVIKELTKLLEEGKIKIPEKKISFTIRRNAYRVEPLPSSVVRRYLKQENDVVKKHQSNTKPPKKKLR